MALFSAPSNRRWRRRLAAAVVVALALNAPARAVELELVLALDASTSVDYREFNLQMAGYAAAFRNRDFIDAVETFALDGIAVCMTIWAGPGQSRVAIDWSIVRDGLTANAFAEAMDFTPRVVWGGSTAIGDSLAHAIDLIEGNGIDGRRLVIDVSGDGRANDGLPLLPSRSRAARLGITVNGLTILNEEPDLRQFYQSDVIVGPAAFVETAESYDDFSQAILRKLIREIRGTPVAFRVPENDRQSARIAMDVATQADE